MPAWAAGRQGIAALNSAGVMYAARYVGSRVLALHN